MKSEAGFNFTRGKWKQEGGEIRLFTSSGHLLKTISLIKEVEE